MSRWRQLTMSQIAAAAVLSLIPLSCIWYWFAGDYLPSGLVGTYVRGLPEEHLSLQLRADGTFHEVLNNGWGTRQTAEGTWHVIGESGVYFSPTFLRMPGEKNFIEIMGHGDGGLDDLTFYGHFDKWLTLFPRLRLEPEGSAPMLVRKPSWLRPRD